MACVWWRGKHTLQGSWAHEGWLASPVKVWIVHFLIREKGGGGGVGQEKRRIWLKQGPRKSFSRVGGLEKKRVPVPLSGGKSFHA